MGLADKPARNLCGAACSGEVFGQDRIEPFCLVPTPSPEGMEVNPCWNEEGGKVFDEIIRFVSVLVFHMIEYFARKFGVIIVFW
jgi:hypothetical protein